MKKNLDGSNADVIGEGLTSQAGNASISAARAREFATRNEPKPAPKPAAKPAKKEGFVERRVRETEEDIADTAAEKAV